MGQLKLSACANGRVIQPSYLQKLTLSSKTKYIPNKQQGSFNSRHISGSNELNYLPKTRQGDSYYFINNG